MRRAKSGVKEKPRTKGMAFKFSVCLFVVYITYMLVQQQVTIQERQTELLMLEDQVQTQRLQNKEMERLLESENEAYIARIAKDRYGYAYPDETIYIDTSGN